jgi:hypothetical protein
LEFHALSRNFSTKKMLKVVDERKLRKMKEKRRERKKQNIERERREGMKRRRNDNILGLNHLIRHHLPTQAKK